MQVSFKKLKQAFSDKLLNQEDEISSVVGSVVSLGSIKINMVKDTEDALNISVTGFDIAVSESKDVYLIKRIVLDIFEEFPIIVKRIKSSYNELRLNIIKDEELTEAVIKVFKRKGNKLLPTLKCIGGMKDGKRVSDPSVCMQPPSYNRRVGAKKGSKKKGSISKSRNRTKVTNIVSRQRLAKANKRLKKARGF